MNTNLVSYDTHAESGVFSIGADHHFRGASVLRDANTSRCRVYQ